MLTRFRKALIPLIAAIALIFGALPATAAAASPPQSNFTQSKTMPAGFLCNTFGRCGEVIAHMDSPSPVWYAHNWPRDTMFLGWYEVSGGGVGNLRSGQSSSWWIKDTDGIMAPITYYGTCDTWYKDTRIGGKWIYLPRGMAKKIADNETLIGYTSCA